MLGDVTATPLLAALGLLSALLTPLAARSDVPWAPARVRASQARTLARQVQTRLQAQLPLGDVQVSVDLPAPLAAPVDHPPLHPRVIVTAPRSAMAGAARVSDATVAALAAAEVPGARPGDVQVRWVAKPPGPVPATWVSVGPFRVEPGSAAALRGALLGLLATAFALSALLLRYTRRRPRHPG